MPSYLILRLAGPHQSWAGQSAIKTRVDTAHEPSSRALIGFLSAAFGVPRGAALPAELERLTFHVKTLKRGRIVRDYQTIGPREDELEFAKRVGRIMAKGAARHPNYSWPGTTIKGRKFPGVVNRTYLADAEFLVLVEGTEVQLKSIRDKLLNPVWAPYLGKKAFPLSLPYVLPVISGEMDEAWEQAKLILEKAKNELLGFTEKEL